MANRKLWRVGHRCTVALVTTTVTVTALLSSVCVSTAYAKEKPAFAMATLISDRSLATTWSQRLVSLSGIVVLLAVTWLLSYRKRKLPWQTIFWGLGLQFLLGILILKTAPGAWFFAALSDCVNVLTDFSKEGARFLFGSYVDKEFTFALHVLPTIIFTSALMAVLYHWKILQYVVSGLAWVMQRTMRTTGAETLAASANIFLGQTEAPLVIKPFLERMSNSELMAVMVGGFATVAGSVLAAYVGMLRDVFPDIAGHLIASSVLNAPASLVIAKILLPADESEQINDSVQLKQEQLDANVIGALTRGAAEGMMLAATVAAMFIALFAVVALVNHLFEWPTLEHNAQVWRQVTAALKAKHIGIPEGCSHPGTAEGYRLCIEQATQLAHLQHFDAWQPWTLQRIFGFIFWPFALVMGVPVSDCMQVGMLLGEKTVLNEFVAYLHLGELLRDGTMGPRAALISTYALCGFANLGSIGVQIGGIGALAPSRRNDLAKIGFRAMLGGTLASFITACIAGILV